LLIKPYLTPKKQKMILVTGVTGHLGKAVIDLLLDKIAASELAVLVRDASKAEELKAKGVAVRIADYNDYQSLVKAFEGIEKLYFVSGTDVHNRSKQHQNVVKAAKEAKVKHVIYTSFQRRNETPASPIAAVAESHLKTEQWLIESGMVYTILRQGLYMDMLPIFMGDKVLETGVIYQPAGEGKTAFASRKDMAEAAAAILTSDGHDNKIYEIAGNKAYSYAEIAGMMSDITGKNIVYVSPAGDEFIKTLTGAGVPPEYAGMFAGFAEAIKQGEFNTTGIELETLLGKKPTLLKDFLKEVYSSKN
jgi:NAD(P)H dehydrogenase (quinone)